VRLGLARGAALRYGTNTIPWRDAAFSRRHLHPRGGDESDRALAPGGRRAGPQSQDIPMPVLLNEYLPLVIFIALSAIISGALLVAPFLLAFKAPDAEKLSAYECGFNAFDDARMKFDVRFYLVSLLFIIFDLEVAFLFPWAVAFRKIGVFGFWSMMVFLGVLTVGFIYEWKKGALEWD
jgi:NADH-quinone oxidoreductase subunit A